MVKKNKVKDDFQDFRSNDKLSFKTFKIPLKTILHNQGQVQPIINNLVFDINDLVIHSYQFIRLYLLHCFTNKITFPTIDETFIICSIKTLGIRDNRGKQNTNTDLLEKLSSFYDSEYQSSVSSNINSLFLNLNKRDLSSVMLSVVLLMKRKKCCIKRSCILLERQVKT